MSITLISDTASFAGAEHCVITIDREEAYKFLRLKSVLNSYDLSTILKATTASWGYVDDKIFCEQQVWERIVGQFTITHENNVNTFITANSKGVSFVTELDELKTTKILTWEIIEKFLSCKTEDEQNALFQKALFRLKTIAAYHFICVHGCLHSWNTEEETYERDICPVCRKAAKLDHITYRDVIRENENG